MSIYNLLNLVFFQGVWFSSVLGAGVYGLHWLPFAALAALAVLAWRGPSRTADLQVAAVGTCVGLLIDNLWVALGLLVYPHNEFAPYWIALMWVGFGLTVNHSMAFLRDKTLIGAVVVGTLAPFSYLAAERLGAVTIAVPTLLFILAIAWFIVFYGLARYARWLLRASPKHQNQPLTDTSA